VTTLEYEVDPEHVVSHLAEVASAARAHWPMVGRLALLHRVGPLEVGEISVVVVVASSAPPR